MHLLYEKVLELVRALRDCLGRHLTVYESEVLWRLAAEIVASLRVSGARQQVVAVAENLEMWLRRGIESGEGVWCERLLLENAMILEKEVSSRGDADLAIILSWRDDSGLARNYPLKNGVVIGRREDDLSYKVFIFDKDGVVDTGVVDAFIGRRHFLIEPLEGGYVKITELSLEGRGCPKNRIKIRKGQVTTELEKCGTAVVEPPLEIEVGHLVISVRVEPRNTPRGS